MSLPFLSTALLAVAIIAGFSVGTALPSKLGRLRLLIGVAAALVIGLVAALAGWLPWRGELRISAYGVLLLLGFAGAFALAAWRAPSIGLDRRQLIDFLMLALLGGLIGARLTYVVERPSEFVGLSPGEAFALAADFDRGGMVWYGGALTATLFMWCYALAKGLPKLAIADVFLPGVLLGLAIGRIGCFTNGCCFGSPTSLPWGCPAAPHGPPLHPTQLYETLAAGLIALAGVWWWSRRSCDGQVTVFCVVGYALWRFLNEFLRDKGPLVQAGPFTSAQWISICLVLGCVLAALALRWHWQRNPAAAAAARLVPGSRHARTA